MPSAVNDEEADDAQRMRAALKRYIILQRQKKKEEYEAVEEEARLRREREARERQDVMTLEETKEQIDQLEQKLKQLEKEKQQLFMQLKKVLNEDETRKKQQQQRESNEQQVKLQNMQHTMPPAMFPPPSQEQGRPPPLTSHILNKNKHSGYMLLQQPPLTRTIQSGNKRQRTPSPTYSLYNHRLHQPQLKHQTVYSDHKMEDGRMGRPISRAVLWNKSSQYGTNVSNSGMSSYYAMPNSAGVVVTERPPPLLYTHQPHHGNLMYAPAPQPQPLYLDMLKNNQQHQHQQHQQHQEPKKDPQSGGPQVLIGLSEQHHPAVSGGYQTARHLIHPSQHNNIQPPKSGSITQGYPVQQPNPNVQNPNMYNRHRY